MNIFALDLDPKIAAQMSCDKHAIKMVLESTQLLSTAMIKNGDKGVYKLNHVNHPCTIWAAKTKSNFNWLKQHFLALCEEYTFRYGKIHKCQQFYDQLNDNKIPDGPLTEFAQAMPEYCKVKDDPVKAYRNYYINEKYKFATWKKREKPDWFVLNDEQLREIQELNIQRNL